MKAAKRLMSVSPIALGFVSFAFWGVTFAQPGCCSFSASGSAGVALGWKVIGGIFMVAFGVLVLLGIAHLIRGIGNSGRVVPEQMPAVSNTPVDNLNKHDHPQMPFP